MYKIILLSMFFSAFISCNTNTHQHTLKVMTSAEPTGILPYGSNGTSANRVRIQIFENLLTFDTNGNLVPQLAISWTNISPTILQLKIREGVRFHDGSSLTVQDVKYSLEKSMSSPHLQTILGIYKEVVIIDEYTIQIHLYQSSSIEEALLATPGIVITSMSSDYDGKSDEYADKKLYNGTGPFRFVEWEQGKQIILERNPYYWGKTVVVDKIEYRFEENAKERIDAIKTRKVDIAYDIEVEDKQYYQSNNLPVKFYESQMSHLEYLGMRIVRPPLDNQCVREAIAMSIDIERLIKNVMNGGATLATSVINDKLDFYTPMPKRIKDINKAKQMLMKAGVVEGQEIELWTIKGYREELAQFIKEDLKHIGLEIKIVLKETQQYYEGIRGGKAPMFFLSQTAFIPDADAGMFPLLHSSSVGSGGNQTLYRSGEMDEYLNIGRKSANTQIRKEAYALAQKLAYEDVPFVPLFYPMNIVAVAPNISNFVIGDSFIHELKTVVIN